MLTNYPTKIKKVLDKYTDKVYTSREELENNYKGHVDQWDQSNLLFDQMLMTLQENKRTFSQAWDKVKKYFPEGTHPPVFAGGFLRDLLIRQRPNDLDLFVNTHGISDDDEAEDLISLFCYYSGLKFSRQQDVEQYDIRDCWGSKKPFSIFNFTRRVGHSCPVQVIGRDCGPDVASPLDFCRDFDYSLVMQASPVGETFEIHCSQLNEASFGEQKVFITREGGKDRFLNRVFRTAREWKKVDLYVPKNSLENKKKRGPFDYLKENFEPRSPLPVRQIF